MNDEWFVLGLTAVFTLVLSWGFRTLPREKWQILAALPTSKDGNGGWIGQNITYYGVFNANAYVLGVAVFILLLGSLSLPLTGIVVAVAALLAVCMPAASLVARVVEKKRYTFTVGGASFVGILVAPWLVTGLNAVMAPSAGIPVMPFLAALALGYAFGEGIGRLACISFGCCYGKPLCRCHSRIRKLFEKRCFVFLGATKKISYADGLEGEQVIPIQAVTAVIYCGWGVLGVYLFLKGFYFTAFFTTLAVTQAWRTASEFFRADYRGGGKISAYQIMGGISILYGLVILFFFSEPVFIRPVIGTGLGYLWRPEMILFLQILWVAVFLHTGRSRVTGSSLSFHVIRQRV